MLATAIMNAVRFPGRIVDGRCAWKGPISVSLVEAQLRQIRGVEISLIGTNPRSKLNPLLRVGRQIADVIQAHEQIVAAAALAQRGGADAQPSASTIPSAARAPTRTS